MEDRVARVDRVIVAWSLLLAACNKDDARDSGGESCMDDLPPSTQCPGTSVTGACAEETSAVEATSAASGGSCAISDDCANGQACVAPFDGEIGDFVCVPGCIGLMDDASWCADASACCDADAICTPRGYCVVPDAGTSGEGGSSGST
jgi:hypothetical protein